MLSFIGIYSPDKFKSGMDPPAEGFFVPKLDALFVSNLLLKMEAQPGVK